MGRLFFCVLEWFIHAVLVLSKTIDRSLIELIRMQQNRNNNRKYTVKFFNSAGFKGGDFGGGILFPGCLILTCPGFIYESFVLYV